MATKEQTDGDRVRELLEEQGREHQWLAKKLGISPTVMSRLLFPRQLTANQKMVIANSLAVPFDSLFKEGE